MSFLKNIFGQNDGENKENSPSIWNELTDVAQLDEVVTASATQTCVIFKHSTRCIVSRTALKQFEMEYVVNEDLKLYFLDLLSHRDISNAIAERFGVEHQSPQIVVIKSGEVVYHTSHSSIDATVLERYV